MIEVDFMKKALKIASNTLTVLLFVLLIFMIFVVISSKASGGEPQFLGYQMKSVLSGSMEPTFKTGSIIVIKLVSNPEDLKKADIITFLEKEDTLVTHRVIEVFNNGDQKMYRTKGDNNQVPDVNATLSQNVVGKYTGYTIPYMGYVVNLAKSKYGIAALLIFPGILLLGYSGVTLYKAIKEIDKMNKKNEKEVQATF